MRISKYFLYGAYTGLILGSIYSVFVGGILAYRNALLIYPLDAIVITVYLIILYGIAGSIILGFISLAITKIPFFSQKSFRQIFPILFGLGSSLIFSLLLWNEDVLPGRLLFLTRIAIPGLIAMVLAAFLIGASFSFAITHLPIKKAFLPRKKWIPLGFLFLLGAFIISVLFFEGRAKNEKSVSLTQTSLKSENEQDKKLLIIAVDGMTWSVINPLIESNKLPNIQRLIESGSFGSLKTIFPTVSPVVWTSIATGKKYQKHGITDFLVYPVFGLKRPLSKFTFALGLKSTLETMGSVSSPITSTLRAEKAFWNILTEAGISVGVVGWWGSWPSEEVNGFMVSDRVLRWISAEYEKNERSIVYPDSLFEEIASRVKSTSAISGEELGRFLHLKADELNAVATGNYNHFSHLKVDKLKVLKVGYNTDKWRHYVGRYLYETYQPTLFAIYFSGIDASEHSFWEWMEPEYFPDTDKEDVLKYGDVIENYYIYQDEIIGDFIELLGNKGHILICSDHGHHANRNRSNSTEPSGIHEDAPDGVFIVSGEGIRKGYKINRVDIYDILPTILYLSGLPVAKDMRGRVVEEVFEEYFLDNHPTKYIDSYGPHSASFRTIRSSSDNEVKEQLKNLGYIQ